MGEKHFFAFMQMYLMSHKYKSVTVEDLKNDFTLYVNVLFECKVLVNNGQCYKSAECD
jgi:hypothetical protein